MLSPIPLATLPPQYPRSPYTRESSELVIGNRFHNHIAKRTALHEIRAFHERQEEARKEAYAAGWVLAA